MEPDPLEWAQNVVTPDQIPTKLRVYQDYEMKAFIQSGYPHQSERDLFTRHVLPSLNYAPLSQLS
ncbi:hypothetical protein DmGdi_25370 [Gluconobacter sp. Gdi]|nr:hypothetical protein DmGdi_25370 [Gluconobacter sp. Gdi]